MGGLAQAAPSLMLSAGKNAAGDVIATAISHTKWLDSIGMRQVLAASDFRLEDLNDGATTIYRPDGNSKTMGIAWVEISGLLATTSRR